MQEQFPISLLRPLLLSHSVHYVYIHHKIKRLALTDMAIIKTDIHKLVQFVKPTAHLQTSTFLQVTQLGAAMCGINQAEEHL